MGVPGWWSQLLFRSTEYERARWVRPVLHMHAGAAASLLSPQCHCPGSATKYKRQLQPLQVMSEKLDVVRLAFYTAPVSLACLAPFYWVYEVRIEGALLRTFSNVWRPPLVLQWRLFCRSAPWCCPARRSALSCLSVRPPPPCLAGLVPACLPPSRMPRSLLPSAPTAAQALLGIPALPHQRCGCHHSRIVGNCGLLQSGEGLGIWRGSGGPKSPRGG